MRPLLLLILSIVIFCLACTDEQEDPVCDYSCIDTVTGLRLLDANGVPIGLWRDPNDKPSKSFAFPNPNDGAVFVFSELPMQNIWILNGQCLQDSLNTGIIDLAQSLNYNAEEVQEIDIQQYTVNGDTQLTLNLSDLSEGFYRLFVELNTGEINWQNIYIDPDLGGLVDLDALEALCD